MKRIVTLPPGLALEAQLAFAARARRGGADLLELRSDLYAADGVAAQELSRALPLLLAERGRALPHVWLARAAEIDRPLGSAGEASIRSLHAEGPLAPAEAVSAWETLAPKVSLKHVEPLGAPGAAARLLETQAQLGTRFGRERVTVLATGPLALPFRAVLAAQNALDYLALDSGWAAAPGQRLLADAVRAGSVTAGVSRRGILGTGLAHSRSPRIHRQPFDRIDVRIDLRIDAWPDARPNAQGAVPADAALGPLLSALHPFYDGLAVTSPFKIAAARAVGSALPAVNTLIRRGSGWAAANTDVAGAAALFRRLGSASLTILGDGGATVALRLAAKGRKLEVLRRADAPGTLGGDVVWTWPQAIAPPAGLRFRAARVAIVAYGLPARRIAAVVRQLGGEPLMLGACWFVAQARAQRSLWEGLS